MNWTGLEDDWDQGIKREECQTIAFHLQPPWGQKTYQEKKKLKAKELQDGMAHGSVIRRKTAEDFEEKVGTA